MKYCIFLRGINVGGIKVPMLDLRKNLEQLQLRDVTTYLQTGNVVCESELPLDELKSSVETLLSEKFNYQAFVLIYPYSVLSLIVSDFPFKRSDNEHAYVIFCENQHVIDDLVSHEPDIDHSIEEIQKGDYAVYWRVPKGKTLDTTFSKIMSKPKYKASTTNRNVNTLEKMLA